MAKTTTLAIPSLLSYERSINPSEAAFWGVMPDGEVVPVPLKQDVTVRGSISNHSAIHGKASDVVKQLKPENANIQRSDYCYLPADCSRFKISFSLAIRSAALAPQSCNDRLVDEKLVEFLSLYRDRGGFDELAARYAWRIASARWLWRNSYALNKKVTVYDDYGERVMSFDADGIDSFVFPGLDALGDDGKELAQAIADALSGKSPALFLKITAEGDMAPGQELFPSQEFVDDDGKAKKQGSKSKYLSGRPYAFNGESINQATLHSQKIGNALRQIDDWHGEVDRYGAIAVEPAGYVQHASTLVRPADTKRDFYSLFQNLDDLRDQLASAASPADIDGDIHFLVAVLVRGGVFSKAREKKG